MKTDAEEKREKINDDTEDIKRQIKLLKQNRSKKFKLMVRYSFEAEKKTSLVEIKAALSTANTLKRTAFEKQELIDKRSAKKRRLIEKKADI